MSETLIEQVADSALIRRVQAAVYATPVNRFEVMLEWPECHAKRCKAHHGSPERALGIMQATISEAVKLELTAWTTTRPDVAEDGDSDAEVAVYTLAELLRRYNVHDAGTFVRAARLIVEAYPDLVQPLVSGSTEPARGLTDG